MKTIIERIKNLYSVSKNLPNIMRQVARAVQIAENASASALRCQKAAERAETYLRNSTEAHLDVSASAKDKSFVLVVGKYKGLEYVNIIDLPPQELDSLIDELRRRTRGMRLGLVDAPHTLRHTINRGLR